MEDLPLSDNLAKTSGNVAKGGVGKARSRGTVATPYCCATSVGWLIALRNAFSLPSWETPQILAS